MEETNKKYILWTHSDYGWHPRGFNTIKEALSEERYTFQWFITTGKIDWEVIQKCPYPDCPKVKYKECPVHGTPPPIRTNLTKK